jgi:hypothetical protein
MVMKIKRMLISFGEISPAERTRREIDVEIYFFRHRKYLSINESVRLKKSE